MCWSSTIISKTSSTHLKSLATHMMTSTQYVCSSWPKAHWHHVNNYNNVCWQCNTHYFCTWHTKASKLQNSNLFAGKGNSALMFLYMLCKMTQHMMALKPNIPFSLTINNFHKTCAEFFTKGTSAVQSKNAVCAFIDHSRYFHKTYTFTSMHTHAKKLYLHMFDIVDTSYER